LENTARIADLKKRTSVICEPFRSAVAWLPDDTEIKYNKIAYWHPVPWDNHNGSVTLAGDAAHPMTPRMYNPKYAIECY
jgi:2-polyprenyl-6-methoxyphenol hydroxylase-like FAD-dependent oxidoreductase